MQEDYCRHNRILATMTKQLESFRERELLRDLGSLPGKAQLAFALACASRQRENFERASTLLRVRDSSLFRLTVDALWDVVAGRLSGTGSWESMLERVNAAPIATRIRGRVMSGVDAAPEEKRQCQRSLLELMLAMVSDRPSVVADRRRLADRFRR